VWDRPAELPRRGRSPSGEDTLIELLVTSDPVRLSFLQSLLADAGVESFVFDGEGPWLGAIPSRLMVSSDDEAAARRVLESV
jgi:hypothetical protein